MILKNTVDVCAKVYLAHVIVAEDSRISGIWRVMRGAVVQTATGRERQTWNNCK